MENKRRLERFDLQVPANIEIVATEQDRGTFSFTTSNICSGGAFFETVQPLPEGSKVKIELTLPLERFKKLMDDAKDVQIVVTGLVLRSEKEEMAVCFHEDYEIRPMDSASITKH